MSSPGGNDTEPYLVELWDALDWHSHVWFLHILVTHVSLDTTCSVPMGLGMLSLEVQIHSWQGTQHPVGSSRNEQPENLVVGKLKCLMIQNACVCVFTSHSSISPNILVSLSGWHTPMQSVPLVCVWSSTNIQIFMPVPYWCVWREGRLGNFYSNLVKILGIYCLKQQAQCKLDHPALGRTILMEGLGLWTWTFLIKLES